MNQTLAIATLILMTPAIIWMGRLMGKMLYVFATDDGREDGFHD